MQKLLSYVHFNIYSQVPRPLGATPLLEIVHNLYVTFISTTTQNLKLLGAKMTQLCAF